MQNLQNRWRLTMDLVGYYDEELRKLVLVEETKKKPRGLNKRKSKQISENTEFEVKLETTDTGRFEVAVRCNEIPGWFVLEGLSKELTLEYLMLNTEIKKGVVQEKLIPIVKDLSGFSFITKDDPNISEYLIRRNREYASLVSTKTKTRKEGHLYFNTENDDSEVFLGTVEDDSGYKYCITTRSKLITEKTISDILKRNVTEDNNSELGFNIYPAKSVSSMVDFGEVVNNDVSSNEDLVRALIMNAATMKVIKNYLTLSNHNAAFYTDSAIKNHIQKTLDSEFIDYILAKGGKDKVKDILTSAGNNLAEFYNDFCDLNSINRKYLSDRFKLAPNSKAIYDNFNMDDFLGDWDKFLKNYKKVHCWDTGQGNFYLDRRSSSSVQKIEELFGKKSELGKVLIELGNHAIDTFGDSVFMFMTANSLNIVNIKLEDVLEWVNNKPSLELMSEIIKFKFVELEAVLESGFYFD